MKLLLSAVSMFILLTSCEELDPKQQGNLVPKTVDQDASIPSITINGTQLHAETFGDPADPMIIFLHGGPGSDYRNALQVSQLAADGFYIVFYDQRGSGLSKRHPLDSYTIEVMFDDLRAVIEHYRTTPQQKVFLFGHSWGAMLAAGYINSYPDRINGAILAEPGGLTWESAKEYGQMIRKLRLFSEATNDALYTDQFLSGDENQHEMLDYKLGISSSYAYADGNEEGIEGPSPFWRMGAVVLNSLTKIGEDEGFDFTTNLDQYTSKVLFLYSENNRAYGLTFAQNEASYFPNTEIARVDDTGHEMIYFGWGNVYPIVSTYLNSVK